jgi:EpsI family protein
MEGWVIFLACVLILFGLARVMLMLNPRKMTLSEALDLQVDGLGPQAARLRLIEPSRALVAVALVMVLGALAWAVIPARPLAEVDRARFQSFPLGLGDWNAGVQERLDPQTEKVLQADDYYSARLTSPGEAAPVELFSAWYRDQMQGGTHSPTVCLPSTGWEIASLDTISAPEGTPGAPFTLNRAMIRKGLDRMLVYYWYDQQGLRTASSYYARLVMALSKVKTGRSDGAIVRLITPILPGETEASAETRLQKALKAVVVPLPLFLPG